MEKKKNKSGISIGLFLGMIDESYQMNIWPAVEEVCKEYGINLLLIEGRPLNTPYMDNFQHNVVYSLINQNNIDGLIILAGTMGQHITQKELKKFCDKFNKIPIVCIAQSVPGYPSVLVDNKAGMKEAVNHLIENHGYEKIAFIKGPDGHQEAEDRFNAYIEVLKKHNIDYDPNLVAPGNFVMDKGIDAVNLLLDERKIKFEALISVNDDMAIGAFEELRRKGINVPGDIALIGFDDTESVKFYNPSITSVSQPFYDQAKKSVQILIDLIDGKKVKNKVYLPTKLVIRESCGCNCKLLESNVIDHESNIIEEAKILMSVIHKSIRDNVFNGLIINGVRKKFFYDWIENLICSLKEDLNDTSNFFLNKINEIYIELSRYKISDYHLQNMLKLLEKTIIDNTTTDYLKLFFRKKFKQAEIFLSNIKVRSYAYNSIELRRSILNLRWSGQKINTSLDINKLIETFISILPNFDINTCFISFYEGKIDNSQILNWNIPEHCKLILAYVDKVRLPIDLKKSIYKSKDLLPVKYFISNRRFTMILKPLFFINEHYGFILFEPGSHVEIIYETLRSQLSSALKGTLIFKKQLEMAKELKDALDALEHTNKKLQSMSLRDDLTGLYNRRGFMTLGEQHIKLAQRTNKNFLIFFIDLDDLKLVNDRFGHNEGDKAIINASKILIKTFREADIIARLGGDEFTILAVDSSIDNIDTILKRLYYNIEKFNNSNNTLYKLSMSIGVAPYYSNSNVTLDMLLNEADHVLYEQKFYKKNK